MSKKKNEAIWNYQKDLKNDSNKFISNLTYIFLLLINFLFQIFKFHKIIRNFLFLFRH